MVTIFHLKLQSTEKPADKPKETKVETKKPAKKGGKKGKGGEEGEEGADSKKVQYLGPPGMDLSKDLNFGVCHIKATFNDTFIHVTDLSGRETYVRVTGGMKVKSDREEKSPYAAMLAAQDVYARLKLLGINAIHFKVRGQGGIGKSRLPGQAAQSAMRSLARLGLRIGRIEDVTPIPTDSCRRAGGRRGRRL